VVALAVSGCDREERHSRAKPIGETIPGESPNTIFPGSSNPPSPDPRGPLYDNNAQAIAQGQTLYTQMNCVGCHSHGGGGMGPPLMDDEWRYGGRIDQIATTITEGRPNGMPSWRGKLTEDQIWQLAAYVRSMSRQQSTDKLPSRSEEMSGPTPETLAPRQPMYNSDAPQQ
jgi:cytochrome c oxidase cbb3-type subunit 3